MRSRLGRGTWVTIRAIAYVLLLSWPVLFHLGARDAYPPEEPQIGPYSLWHLCESLPSYYPKNSSHETAIDYLRVNRDVALPTLKKWARRRESIPRSVYFCTMDVILGKRAYFCEYGKKAHSYRGRAAKAFGWCSPSDAEAIAELERISRHVLYTDYERTIAQRGIDRLERAATE